MNLRFPSRFGTIALFFALTGCAVPPSQTTSSANQKKAVDKTAAAAKADSDKQLNFDSALASMPAADSKDAKKSSLADAEPIDGKDVSDFRQTGRASWYGRDFHGRRTANGERFNMNALTAAHRTLPLSSYIKVTNSSTGKWVVVKVNDRGPFKRGRVLDLSYAAAKMIGLVHAGTGRVKIEGLSPQEAREARDEMFASVSAK
ncbi:septal ring lytic transglycosylase RlpA family protein [Burkholderia sp. AU31624]|uniref:septal ring lytic transglycosylase RlpA family protein n=1 Tax=unclassified Burkholderia TaxID=2613784 RepID=UPI000B7A98C2|nr:MULTISPECIES: septal ring lytic transglycosylase RlpA family protein [unclassified Burkholderia]MCA8258779.1 septal ring lytic transglycosylase RlpA family protein [Burkholderia sp. AU31624]OXI27968.1 septal ring lytic transglycosylase RlpA family lipoprotein [Burkholderia sp. AU15512]